MKNANGFTLVELLAVIVILAIVALVTTPAILNVINNSRLEGAKDKAWGTIDAVRLAYTQAQTAGYEDGDTGGAGVAFKTGSTTDLEVTFGSTTPNFGGKKAVTYSGDKPTAGKVTINVSTGLITADGLKFEGNGTYTCKTNASGTNMCCQKGDSAPSTCA